MVKYYFVDFNVMHVAGWASFILKPFTRRLGATEASTKLLTIVLKVVEH